MQWHKLESGKNPRFLDLIENRTASEDNPNRRGIFVQTIYRNGRMNRGKFYQCTNGKGKFWLVNPGADLWVQPSNTDLVSRIQEKANA